MIEPRELTLSCPVPREDGAKVLLGHGGGGRLMHRLIEETIAPGLADTELQSHHDGAVLRVNGSRLAFTTDSHVVSPLFFPGGDIGKLAVHGTVNDLAMCGARPLWLSCGLILEEGLALETLKRVLRSIRDAAREAAVHVVTGDTKVVERGKADGVFVNTAGVGIVEHDLDVAPESVRPGDVLLLSGDIGRHGMAVMSTREGLGFVSSIESDCAPVAVPVLDLLERGVRVRCLRDLTRGGLAAALHEIARAAGVAVTIDEERVVVRDDVRNACEIFGLDPLYVANEGRFVAFVEAQDAALAEEILRGFERSAGIVGRVGERRERGVVTMRTALGFERFVDLPSGEQLPRIC
jgi:hydrogenase expression/formation protein HypE